MCRTLGGLQANSPGFRDRRLSVEPIGLGAETGAATLYGAGLLGASLYASKAQKARHADLLTEPIDVVRASDWFRKNIPAGADVYMKLNCEGAECDILNEMLDAGLADRLTSLYIDFDIRKVEGQRHRQATTEQRLRQAKVRYVTSESLGCVANSAVKKWLRSDCPRCHAGLVERLQFRLALHAPVYVRMKRLARAVLPARIFSWLGHRFGRMARA